MQPAQLWRRFAANCYDSIVVLALWMIVGFIVLSLFGIEGNVEAGEGQVELAPAYQTVLLAAMILSAFLFFAWFWTHSGQTIGMMAWKLRVSNADGSAISWRQSLIRFVLGAIVTMVLVAGFWQYQLRENLIPGILLVCLYGGFWLHAQLHQGNTLTDTLSGSLVIRTKR